MFLLAQASRRHALLRKCVILTVVAPAEAGVQAFARSGAPFFAWIPAYAGTIRLLSLAKLKARGCSRFFAPVVVSLIFPDSSAKVRESAIGASSARTSKRTKCWSEIFIPPMVARRSGARAVDCPISPIGSTVVRSGMQRCAPGSERTNRPAPDGLIRAY